MQRIEGTLTNRIPSNDIDNLLRLAGEQSKATSKKWDDTKWETHPPRCHHSLHLLLDGNFVCI